MTSLSCAAVTIRVQFVTFSLNCYGARCWCMRPRVYIDENTYRLVIMWNGLERAGSDQRLVALP